MALLEPCSAGLSMTKLDEYRDNTRIIVVRSAAHPCRMAPPQGSNRSTFHGRIARRGVPILISHRIGSKRFLLFVEGVNEAYRSTWSSGLLQFAEIRGQERRLEKGFIR